MCIGVYVVVCARTHTGVLVDDNDMDQFLIIACLVA